MVIKLLSIALIASQLLIAGSAKPQILINIPPDQPGMHYGYISNERGRIGIRVEGNRITRVYHHSPAERKGLQVGDKIISCDGKKTGEVLGTVGSFVELRIKRKDIDQPFTVFVQRVPFHWIDQKEWI